MHASIVHEGPSTGSATLRREVTDAVRTFDTSIGTLGVESTATGLRRVSSWRRRASVDSSGDASAAVVAERSLAQLDEYLRGEREEFDLGLDWSGVEPTHRHVLETLREVAPYGVTVTYGELGRRAGDDDPRDVGVMMARNPIPLIVPCHRVVAADGLGGYGGGLELKQRLLGLEGVLPPRLGARPATGVQEWSSFSSETAACALRESVLAATTSADVDLEDAQGRRCRARRRRDVLRHGGDLRQRR